MPAILVVDDDEAIRESVGLIFEAQGYEVALAEGGFRALELLRERPCPRVVLFDYLMPNGNGLDLLRGVAADTRLQDCYTYICMAARGRTALPQELQSLMDQLEVPFIAKPFDLYDMVAVVDEALTRLQANCNK